jgi:hypothetical protein
MQGGDGRPKRRFWQRGWFKFLVVAAVVGMGVLVFAAEYIAHHAEPFIRQRLIETLAASFNTTVELDHVSVSVVKGFEVEGEGLRIPAGTRPGESQDGGTGTRPEPLISVDHFSFHTTFKAMLHRPTHVDLVTVDHMEIHIPPPNERNGMLNLQDGKVLPNDGKKAHPKISFTLGELRATNLTLVIEPGKPGKEPLEFDINTLDLQHVGPSEASTYQAVVVNPTPRGLIQAQGHFGPWLSETPRQTPVDGDFTFSDADMNTIKGLGGTLQGKGHYAGVLELLTVDGTADVPNFSLDTANHPMPLRTKYHAYVDGTTGDTTLDPVWATLGHSSFTCRGKVMKIAHQGHDIALDVSMPKGRVEDVLQLSMKALPPAMRGGLTMQAKLHIPPGPQRVPQKLELKGTVKIQQVAFSNPAIQDKVDGLSMRAQGKPKEVKAASTDREAEVRSQMAVDFSLTHGLVTVPSLHYEIPGAKVDLDGVYSMDGNVFEFKGHVQTDATASQMVTGWKSILLKPIDPMFKKHGAGLELPIEISGTHGDFQMRLAMHGGNETPEQIRTEMNGKQRSDIEMKAAKKDSQKADKEDAAAAKSTDLKEAERLHNQAVADRQAAQKHLDAAAPVPQK